MSKQPSIKFLADESVEFGIVVFLRDQDLRLNKVIKSKGKNLTKVFTSITEKQTRYKLLPRH